MRRKDGRGSETLPKEFKLQQVAELVCRKTDMRKFTSHKIKN